MAEKPTTSGKDVVEVPLWWRKINAVELEAVSSARRAQRLPLAVQPGMGDATRQLLADERLLLTAGNLAISARQHRLVALESFNAKLNRVVERAMPGEDDFKPHALQLHESGEGLTFWVWEGEFLAGELLELRFSLFAEQPMPVHAYCRIQRVRREWSGAGIRIECGFENLSPVGSSPRPTAPPAQPVVPVPVPVLDDLPPEPSLWEPGLPEPVLPDRKEPSIWETPPPAPAPALAARPPEPQPVRPAKPPQPPLPLPMPGIEERRAKVDQKLAEGKAMVNADPRVVTARLVEIPSAGPKRQDFRLNDNLPLAWKVVTREHFDQAVAYFNDHRSFPPREAVARQKRLLAECDVLLKMLRQLNVKARRPVVWFREQLDRWFRQANSENEEEFFTSVLMVFLVLIRELNKRPPGAMIAAQVVSLLKDQVELQIARDRLDPEGRKLAKSSPEEDLVEVKRQIAKLHGELRTASSGLYDKLKTFQEVLGMMDLSTQDVPKHFTPEGDAVFTVNLSATGVAWRTSRTHVVKGDLLEVRLGLDPDGVGLETVWAYGRVVVVQAPDEHGKSRVACFFEHMTPVQREKLQIHIARRQREELVRRAAGL
ncbi:MAG: PilZ domain-containing protein [Magnetococcales bacterium]|nr:PilZ domain-containing protein [Magnetococcales bacterium]